MISAVNATQTTNNISYASKPNTIALRPHHFLCLPGYKGYNYNQAQINSWDIISKQLRENPDTDILIKSGKDDLCKKCPNDGSGTAICKDDSVNKLDEKVKFLIGIETGKTYKFSEIMKRMKWVMTPEVHKDLCSDCCWWRKGLCRDTFAENSTSPLLSVTSKGKINTNGLKYVPSTEKAA